MTDPALVASSVDEVRAALAGWRTAAQDAVKAGRSEHQATSATVERSGRAAMEARIGVEDLAGELARLSSALEAARGGVMAAVAAVEARERKHAELVNHVRQTNEAWNGHVWRAQRDYEGAQAQRGQAEGELYAAERLRQSARAQVEGARSDGERAGALNALNQAEVEYGHAFGRHQQAVRQELEQQDRVQRCGRALELARQASAELEGASRDVSTATAAVATARSQLANLEAEIKVGYLHLGRMTQAAEQAARHANQADQDLSTATQHLSEVEDWNESGQRLAMDAGYEMADILQQLRQIDAPMGGGAVAGGGSTRKQGLIGVDRGDGRDVKGHFTGGGGYGASKEAQGLADYADETGRDNVIDEHVRAVLPDGSVRYYDGLSEDRDGTYQGIEVKSGSATRTPSQLAFDHQVDRGVPAKATLHGQPILITSTYLTKVR